MTRSEFWRGFLEGMTPMCWAAWLLYGAGHVAYLLGDRCHVPGMYPIYNRLMLWSLAICERFRFGAPRGCR